MEHYDIVICGGGLTGLLLANLLADTSYRVLVVDAGQPPKRANESAPDASSSSGKVFTSGYAPRVSSLNDHSVTLLDRLNVTDKLARFASFSEMQIRDGEGVGEIHFDAHELGRDRLGIVVENHLVIEALHARLQSRPQIELLFGHELQHLERRDEMNYLTVAGDTEISAELVIAADGGHSKVRELRGGKTIGWQYDQTAIVTTLKTQRGHNNIPRQWFTEHGPLAFLPLFDANLVSIVWSHKQADALKNLSEEQFCGQLEIASEGELGEILATDQRFSFPLRQHHALRYTEPGIALIGDAAHTIHPLAGQGANLGFADAAVLASEIKQAAYIEAGLSDPELLKRYRAQRQPHNLAVASAMEVIKRLYGVENPLSGFLRRGAMRLFNDNQALKSIMVKVATDGAF